MTISSTGSRYSYSGNGSTTSFSFPRQFFLDADIDVYLVDNATNVATLQVLNTHYTVSGAGSPSGGNVTMTVAPPTGKTLVIYRDTAATQGLDLDNVTALPMTSLEAALDRAMMVIDEVAQKVARAISAPLSSIFSFDWTMPTPVASKFLGVNAAGTGLALKSMVAGQGMNIAADETNGTLTFTCIGLVGGGSGNVVGAASSVDRSVPVFSGTTGRLLLDPNVMTITAGGNVGVGTASPTDGKIHIDGGASSANIKFTNTATGQTGTDGLFVGIDASGGAYVYQREANALLLGTSNTTRVTIDSSGNVGIGTAAANTVLNINGTAPKISFYNGGTYNGDIGLGVFTGFGDTMGINARGAAGIITLGTNNTERMRIDSNGNVGIGGTPSARLSSYNTTGAAACQFGTLSSGLINITSYDSATLYQLCATAGANPINSYAIGTQSNIPTFFFINNTAKAVLDTSGNFLITAGGGLGYGTGSGGTVTQITSKATGVTLSKASGQITTSAAALAANTWVSFTVTNTLMGANDLVLVMSANGNYLAKASNPAGGSFSIDLLNRTAGSLSDAVIIYFVIIKGANA